MVVPIVVVQTSKAVAKASLVDSIRDGVMDFCQPDL